jgi:hypothetical protein
MFRSIQSAASCWWLVGVGLSQSRNACHWLVLVVAHSRLWLLATLDLHSLLLACVLWSVVCSLALSSPWLRVLARVC